MDNLDAIAADLASLLSAAGCSTVPTLSQARTWLWTSADARQRANRALKNRNTDAAAAFLKLADALDLTAARMA